MARSRAANAEKYPAVQRISLSIDEFCTSVGISRSTYEKLKRANKQPREMHVGKSVRISQAAVNAWVREREGDCEPVA